MIWGIVNMPLPSPVFPPHNSRRWLHHFYDQYTTAQTARVTNRSVIVKMEETLSRCCGSIASSHKTFHFSYMIFLCLLKFLFINVYISSIFKEKKFRMARVGFDLGASALQCITLNPYSTEDWLTMSGLIWIYIATTLTLTLTLCTNH